MDHDEYRALMTRVKGALEEFAGDLATQNEAPNVVPVAGTDTSAPAPERAISDMIRAKMQLRSGLRKLSTQELLALFAHQAMRRDLGVPLDSWLAAGGQPLAQAISRSPELNSVVTKALDTTSLSPLIRQDLEPVLYELFVRTFPAWERFSKEPANGLVHAFNQVTSYGSASFMSELGTVSDSQSTYVRQTAPIATIATRRSISLRSLFAVQAGGMSYNPEQNELQNALRAIAFKMQKTIFEGNATVSSGTASTEDGAYDPLGFDGLRRITNTARAKDVDPTAATPEDMRQKINDAAIEVMELGGQTSILYTNPIVKGQFDYQQDKNIRYNNEFVNVAVGVLTNAVNTVFGPLPILPVPGSAITNYTRSGNTVADIYLVDESSVSIPYLGSDGPTVLDIPLGVSGQLARIFIVFGMWGLAVKAIGHQNKVRVKQP